MSIGNRDMHGGITGGVIITGQRNEFDGRPGRSGGDARSVIAPGCVVWGDLNALERNIRRSREARPIQIQ